MGAHVAQSFLVFLFKEADGEGISFLQHFAGIAGRMEVDGDRLAALPRSFPENAEASQLTVHALCFSIVPVETNAQCLLNSSNTGSFSSDVLSISFTPLHTSIVKQMAREKGL